MILILLNKDGNLRRIQVHFAEIIEVEQSTKSWNNYARKTDLHFSITRTKTQVYVGCLNHDVKVGITLEKLQSRAGRTFSIVTISLHAVK